MELNGNSSDFNTAADRRAYEKNRSSEDVRKKIEALEQKASEAIHTLQEDRMRTREQDLAEERGRQRLQHLTIDYDDLTMRGAIKKPRSEEEIERNAVHMVDRRTALETMAIEMDRDEQIDGLLGLSPMNREQLQEQESKTPAASEQDPAGIRREVNLGGDFYKASNFAPDMQR